MYKINILNICIQTYILTQNYKEVLNKGTTYIAIQLEEWKVKSIFEGGEGQAY